MSARQDVTAKHGAKILSWSSSKPFKRLGPKPAALMKVLADGEEYQRTDLFRAAGFEANKITSGGSGYTDLTDFRLFATGLLTLRATGCPDPRYSTYSGTRTYWTISEKGKRYLETGEYTL